MMILEKIIYVIDFIVLIYLTIMCSVFFLFIIYSTLEFSKQLKSKKIIGYFELDNSENYIPVSLIVPAYNEEVTICDTINSMLNVDYSKYEIIIVNDGSTDESVKKIIDEYKLKQVYKPMKKSIETKEANAVYKIEYENKSITLIDKENGGKADALNVGINYSKYPIFVAIDADSMLDKNSIKNIVAPFMKNRKTVAIGGNVKISNYITIENGVVTNIESPKKIIVGLQIIEYLRVFLTNRVTWDKINMNLIISGAFGAFNKKVVIDAGGYKSNTIGEDMELVMRIHRHFIENKEEYYISYAPDANCYTQAPDTLKGLKAQRRRWQVGLIHSMFIHENMFLNIKWFLAKLYFLVFEMITPIIELFGMIVVIGSFLFGIINFEFLIVYGFIIFLYSFATSVTSILLEAYAFKNNVNRKLVLRLIFLSLFEPMGYRQIVSLYRLSAFIGYKKGKHKWGTIKRNKNK